MDASAPTMTSTLTHTCFAVAENEADRFLNLHTATQLEMCKRCKRLAHFKTWYSITSFLSLLFSSVPPHHLSLLPSSLSPLLTFCFSRVFLVVDIVFSSPRVLLIVSCYLFACFSCFFFFHYLMLFASLFCFTQLMCFGFSLSFKMCSLILVLSLALAPTFAVIFVVGSVQLIGSCFFLCFTMCSS